MHATGKIRRTAAVGAAISGLLHLLMLGHGHLGSGLLMAGMAIVCLPCAGHLWRTASPRSWTVIAAMNAGMLAVHLLMFGSDSPDTHAGASVPVPALAQHHGHHVQDGEQLASSHAGAGAGASGLHEILLPAASAVAATEILLAAAGLVLLRRAPRTVLPHGLPGVSR